MCTGGGGGGGDARKQRELQGQQMELQKKQFRRQMKAQRQQLAVQQAQYEEQFAIANAPAPPAPNPVAEAAAMATDVDSGAMARMGSGRRAMRSDLSIRSDQTPGEATAAVEAGPAEYGGTPRRSTARLKIKRGGSGEPPATMPGDSTPATTPRDKRRRSRRSQKPQMANPWNGYILKSLGS